MICGYFVMTNVMASGDACGREASAFEPGMYESFAPSGPWLTTKDEIADPEKLQMQLRLNGELRQDANTSEMIYSIRELVSWWSQITLEPGDVITSGSPAGVIAGRNPRVWLKPGDRIEATIEGLGTLVNLIAAARD